MASPDYPASLHSAVDITAFADATDYLGSTTPTHTDVHDKVEQEILATQTKLGIGSSPASGASTDNVLTKNVDGTTSWKTVNFTSKTTDNLTQGSTNLYSQWSTDSPGIIYGNHIAVGNQADVNGTGPTNSLLQGIFGTGTMSNVYSIQENLTGSPPIYSNAISVKVNSNYDSTPTTVIGYEGLVGTLSGNTVGATIMAGFFGGSIHRGTGTVSISYGTAGVVQNASTSGVITTSAGVYGGINNSSTGTMTTAIGLFAAAAANTGTISNNYGVLVDAQTVGTNNYGIAIGAASTNTLWISHLADPTTSTGGITFGVSKDTNLYRSAANTLKTDDELEVADSAYSIAWNGSLKVPTRNAVYDKIETIMEHRFLVTNTI